MDTVMLLHTLVTSLLTFSLPLAHLLLGCVHLLFFGAYLTLMFDHREYESKKLRHEGHQGQEGNQQRIEPPRPPSTVKSGRAAPVYLRVFERSHSSQFNTRMFPDPSVGTAKSVLSVSKGRHRAKAGINRNGRGIVPTFFAARQLRPALDVNITSCGSSEIGLKYDKATRIPPVYKPTFGPDTSRYASRVIQEVSDALI